MNHRAYSAAVGLLIFVAAVNAQTRDHNEIVRVPKEDPEMASAIAKARATLDDFLVLWRAQPSGASDYKLKVRIGDGENSEHFWVQPFRPGN